MLPIDQQPSNADYILDLTRKLEYALAETRQFKVLFSAVCMIAMDDKGVVRVPVPMVRRMEKIETLEFEQKETAAGKPGSIRIKVTMQDGAMPKPKPKPKAKAKGGAK